MLGTAGLPHILIRFYTVPTATRRPEVGAVGDRPDRRLLPVDAGARLRCRGAARHRRRRARSPRRGGNLASPLLAEAVGGGAGSTGGAVLLALISAVAFATILAVVAGLTLTSASSVAHDLYASVFKKGKATEKDEIKVARIAAFVIGGIAIAAGHPGAEAQHRVPGGAGLRGRGVGEPAVDHLQPVLAAVQHPRRGVEHLRRPDLLPWAWCSSRPVVSGKGLDDRQPVAVPPSIDFSWFPLENPGIVSIPLGFLLGYLGTITSQGAGGRGALHRARGPRPDRRRRRGGGQPLTDLRRQRAACSERSPHCPPTHA